MTTTTAGKLVVGAKVITTAVASIILLNIEDSCDLYDFCSPNFMRFNVVPFIPCLLLILTVIVIASYRSHSFSEGTQGQYVVQFRRVDSEIDLQELGESSGNYHNIISIERKLNLFRCGTTTGISAKFMEPNSNHFSKNFEK